MRRLGYALLALILFIPLKSVAFSASDIATPDGEIAFGNSWLRAMRGQLNERLDPFCIDLLETWLTRLRNQYPLSNIPLTGLCLESHQFNAFAVPGGIIGVNRGVFSDLASEAEIMAVLSHELAHLSQRHHYRQLKNSEKFSMGTLATLAGLLAAVSTQQEQVAQSLIIGGQAAIKSQALAYSRDFETEADRIGLEALNHTGYDPSAMQRVMNILAKKETKIGQNLIFLRTHPLSLERVSDLESRLRQLIERERFTPVMTDIDFQLFRCVQTEGIEAPFRVTNPDPCTQVQQILSKYRSKNYSQAYEDFKNLPDAAQNSLTGQDLMISIAIKAGHIKRAIEGIEYLSLLFPSWITPVIARIDLAVATNQTKLPKEFRDIATKRPMRLDLWLALNRFAKHTKQQHLLFEARGWNALLHGKIEAAQRQLTQAIEHWPKALERKPLKRLRAAIKIAETA
ncbi:M48 family metalloprotease [Litorivicinus sp.]|nr:M48 family metalloprotease [Litorivicinus sp.]